MGVLIFTSGLPFVGCAGGFSLWIWVWGPGGLITGTGSHICGVFVFPKGLYHSFSYEADFEIQFHSSLNRKLYRKRRRHFPS